MRHTRFTRAIGTAIPALAFALVATASPAMALHPPDNPYIATAEQDFGGPNFNFGTGNPTGTGLLQYPHPGGLTQPRLRGTHHMQLPVNSQARVEMRYWNVNAQGVFTLLDTVSGTTRTSNGAVVQSFQVDLQGPVGFPNVNRVEIVLLDNASGSWTTRGVYVGIP